MKMQPNKSFRRDLIIALLIIGLLTVLPGWHARNKVNRICDSVKIGSSLEDVTNNGLFSHNTFTCGFDKHVQSGALVNLVRGSFPFGRDFCVVKIQHNAVVDKHIVLGDVDYDCDSCKSDMRPIVDIEPKCEWTGH